MRVGFALKHVDGPLTGGELHNVRLYRGIAGHGMQPINVWPLPPRMPSGSGARILRLMRIAWLALCRPVDVFVLDNGSRFNLTACRLLKRIRPSLPVAGVVHYLHSRRPVYLRPQRTVVARMEARLLALLDAVICANPFAWRQIRDLTGSSRRLHLNTGGYLPGLLRHRPVAPKERIELLFLGYLAPIKGVDHLVAAMDRLPPGLDIHCHIAGSHDKQPEFARQVIADAVVRGLADRVSFWNDLRGPALERMFARCDVMVLPSLYEGYPLSIIEAQCQGLAVIGTTAGGTPDAVAHGRSGLLVPPGDPAALAEAIASVAVDTDLRRRLVEGGYRKVRQLPTWDETVATFAKILRGLVERSGRTGASS